MAYCYKSCSYQLLDSIILFILSMKKHTTHRPVGEIVSFLHENLFQDIYIVNRHDSLMTLI